MKNTLFIIWLMLHVLSSYSQADTLLEDNGIYSLSLKELSKVEITGSTLTPEKIQAVPSAVTVFTHEEIKRMGFDFLEELMNLVPGFQAYRSSFSSTESLYSSRGRRIGTTCNEVLIMVDGQRMEEVRVSGGNAVMSKFPLLNIERVEFIRGPGAAVYGSNAMMGIINIVTLSNTNEARLGYGTYNRRQGYLWVSPKIGEVSIDVFGRYDADNGDDYRVQNTFGADVIDTEDPRRFGDIDVKVNWRKTYLKLHSNLLKSDKFYELNVLSNSFNKRIMHYSFINLKQGYDWKKIRSYIWLSYSRSRLETATQITAPGELASISIPSSDEALFASANFKGYGEGRAFWYNNWDINNKSSLQFGAEFRHIDAPEITAVNNFDLGDFSNGIIPIRYYGELKATTVVQTASQRDILGLYTQYQQNLFKATRITLGLRFDNFSNIGSQFSPRIGLVQELKEHHSFKLLYGNAFRAPAEQELNLTNNPIIFGNPDLEPETVQSWDLIWLAKWTRISTSVGYFESHFENSIVQVPNAIGGLKFENMDQGPTKGFEFEIYYELSKHWIMRGNYTYIIEKPDLSFREASKVGGILVNFQEKKWNVNLIGTYHGSREFSFVGNNGNLVKLDDYFVLFLKASYDFNKNWQAFIQVKNLGGAEFKSPPLNTELSEGIPNRGQEVLVGIVWQFRTKEN